jgi:DNA-binding LacI/PurR family transcriptional regulator
MSSASHSVLDLAENAHLAPRERVIETLKDWIDSGQLAPGKSLPSERALASSLNVSRVTVRAALKELFDDGLLTPAAPGGPRRVSPAVPMRTSHLMEHAIAMLSDAQPLPPGAALLRGWDSFTHWQAGRSFERAGFHVLNLNSGRLLEGGLKALLAQRPRGLLASHDAGESALGRRVIDACAKRGVAVVVNGDSPQLAQYDRAEADHEQGAYDLTRWLLARGRRRVLCFWRFPQEHEWLRRRAAGYERAMREAGLEPLPVLRTAEFSSRTNDREEFGHMVRTVAGYLVEHLTGPNSVDAIMTATDPHAYQVAAACRLFGRRPNVDLLIAGFDNTWRDEPARPFESVGPIVSADKRNDLIGETLARLLLDRIAGKLPTVPQRVLVPCEVVEVPQTFES